MPDKSPHSPEAIQQEIAVFEENAKKFMSGQMTADSFQRIRLQHGVYGQRQDGVQMIRIKIPMGILSSDQIECIADLAETIAHNNAHITTRQDIQIHYVQLKNTPDMMRKLDSVGLTTREACGNTVRNVTASPSAGVDPLEVFDVTPYANAIVYHLMRNPICQNLGRKFKLAFDGGGVMTALPMLHEIGLVARLVGVNGTEKRGFKVYIGGGLGSSPRVARLIHEFLPMEELIPFVESVIRVFDRYGERKIRMKARMKFLIEKLGWDEFKRLIEQERRELEVKPEWNEYLNHIAEWDESAPVVQDSQIPKAVAGLEKEADFIAWKNTNVWEQKQKGYSMVEVRLTTGDMVPKQMRPLADMLRRYAGGKMRLMVHQNFLIRWVRNQDLPSLYSELRQINLAKKDAQTLYDVTACPGTDTCRLGISSSMGLARTIEKRLYQEDGVIRSVSRDLRIKISGCPNSCGQHHIANMGFYGGALSSDGKMVPAFQLLLGGNYGREMAVGLPICQIPSKNVPDAVVRLVTHFAEKRQKDEVFNDFYKRLGRDVVLQILEDLTKIPTYEERPDYFKDWEGDEEFFLQKGVIGECAGTVVEAIPPQVKDGDEPLRLAEALLGHKEYEASANKAYEAIVKAANGLLYYRMVQTFNDVETIFAWENHFVKTGILPWKDFQKNIQALRSRAADESVAQEWIQLAQSFLKDSQAKEETVAEASPRRKPQGIQPDNLAV